MIRIWQSYACNNSSSYRLLARFVDAPTARSVVSELEEFFAMHALEVDARLEDNELESKTQHALGDKHGFTFSGLLYWGGSNSRLAGEAVGLVVEDTYVVVHHEYCGGFHQLRPYLLARGGVVDAEVRADIQVTAMVRCSEDDHGIDEDLARLVAQAGKVAPFKPPWAFEYDAHGVVACYRDAGMVAIHVPAEPCDISAVRTWLEGHGYDDPVIRLGELEDVLLFEGLAKARCRACNGALEYQHPGLHDIETPQLLCRPCGGFYEVAAFL